ncbi:hypothetical protein [Albirhodobacter sp. R86504]|uniref:hypothetical protein n=1 Tax=Albirhodobacter sp. R86504 TaxID=3093848 RepID=UPI003670B058
MSVARRQIPYAGALIALCAAHGALAAPCVGDAFDQPVPTATNVVTRQVDVPSPQFPGLWQEGYLNGYPYAIYANGEGSFQASETDAAWSATFVCDSAAQTCAQDVTGALSPEGQAGLTMLTRCLLGPVSAPPPPPAPPEVTAAATAEDEINEAAAATAAAATGGSTVPPLPETTGPALDEGAETWALSPSDGATQAPVGGPTETAPPSGPEDATPAAPQQDTPAATAVTPPADQAAAPEETTPPASPPATCGLVTLPSLSEGETLQRMIQLAGGDPGPIDGFPGARTRDALIQVLGAAGASLTNRDAIVALDDLLCTPATPAAQ